MAATPQNFDTASHVYTDGEAECPTCGGDGFVAVAKEYLNYDDVALGVQFYGIGEEPGKAEAYYRAVPPALALALLAALEAEKKRADEAEALYKSGDKLRNDALLALNEYEDENDTLRARVAELEGALRKACNEYEQMKWGEDYEYREAGIRVQQIIDAALKKG